MTAKEYLSRYQFIKLEIQSQKLEWAELHEEAYSIGGMDYSKERVQKSPSQSAPYAKPIECLVDLEKKISDEILQLATERHNIIKTIHKLENPNHIRVLQLVYLRGMDLKTVSSKLKCSYKTVKQLHFKALKAIGQYL